ncbi:MAG: HigA family addiction module antitoxin [Thalassobaculum sp.]|uniref:HigA family addiction module antitoxin n=1 Tax=Thalassobaculum sp. TaxID=2022740 RepID=UPI0032ECDCE8
MVVTLSSSVEVPTDRNRHPGEVLADELAALGMSVAALARASGIPSTYLAEIVASRRPVTPEIALRLADSVGPSARFWLSLQAAHDRAAHHHAIRPRDRRAG